MELRTRGGWRAGLLAAALAAAWPAGAQTYKWVDARGVVTYSNAPPREGVQAGKVDAVAERVSVYTPDAQLVEAMKAGPAREAKPAGLEHEPNAVPPAGAGAAKTDAREAAYAHCVAERRVDCERLLSDAGATNGLTLPPDYATLYYPPAVRAGHFHRRPRPFVVIDKPVPIGVDNRPKVGIDNRPKVGIDDRPKVGIDDRPRVGAPPRNRSSVSYR